MLISGEAILELLKAIETLEKLVPEEEKSEFAKKKQEWEALKKAAWAEYKARERSRQRDGKEL